MQRSFKPQNTGQHRRGAPCIIAPVPQLSERSPPKAEDAGEIPAGSTNLRSVELRLGRPVFRRVVQRELEDPTDRESVSLGGASPLSLAILSGAEATADRHRTFNPGW